jgi:hypothetical protein
MRQPFDEPALVSSTAIEASSPNQPRLAEQKEAQGLHAELEVLTIPFCCPPATGFRMARADIPVIGFF